jgi:hypothetical protein
MLMDGHFAPHSNHLLVALPAAERMQLASLIETVRLALSDVLYEPGQRIAHLHFPAGAVIFLICTMENGATAEAGMVGCEGVAGIGALLGSETASHRAVAQITGQAHCIPVEQAREAFRRGGAFQRVLLLHTQALMA